MLNFLGSLWEECNSEFWGINKKKKNYVICNVKNQQLFKTYVPKNKNN